MSGLPEWDFDEMMPIAIVVPNPVGSEEPSRYIHLCAECGEPFTEEEWDLRHSREDGEDVHERCCTHPGCA